MGFEAPKVSNLSFVPAPSGAHVARCIEVIDMGIHDRMFEGKSKGPAQKIRIAWELPDKKHVFNPDKGEEPFTIGKTYSYSFHENATFRQDLESWRGCKFSPERILAFNLKALLEHPGIINIVHETKENRTIAKVASITPLISGMTCPPRILPTILYTADWGPTHDVFKTLPDWLKEEISKCHNWRPKTGANVDTGNPAAQQGTPPPDSNTPF